MLNLTFIHIILLYFSVFSYFFRTFALYSRGNARVLSVYFGILLIFHCISNTDRSLVTDFRSLPTPGEALWLLQVYFIIITQLCKLSVRNLKL